MKFLKLRRGDSDLEIWINFDRVKYFHQAGSGTKIYLSGEPHDECEVVLESPEFILAELESSSEKSKAGDYEGPAPVVKNSSLCEPDEVENPNFIPNDADRFEIEVDLVADPKKNCILKRNDLVYIQTDQDEAFLCFFQQVKRAFASGKRVEIEPIPEILVEGLRELVISCD